MKQGKSSLKRNYTYNLLYRIVHTEERRQNHEQKRENHCSLRAFMEIIVPQLAKAYGVTEQLKAENQIEWVRQMNACVAQAEEAIKGELIYC